MGDVTWVLTWQFAVPIIMQLKQAGIWQFFASNRTLGNYDVFVGPVHRHVVLYCHVKPMLLLTKFSVCQCGVISNIYLQLSKLHFHFVSFHFVTL